MSERPSSMLRFSLRFSDAALESSYRLDFAEQTRRGARVLGMVAVVVLALAGIPEGSLVEPRFVALAAAIRYGGIVASIAAAVGLTLSRHFHRWMDFAIVAVIAVVCSGYVAIAACYPVEFGPTVRALSILPYGVSGDRQSPHDADQMELFAQGRLTAGLSTGGSADAKDCVPAKRRRWRDGEHGMLGRTETPLWL